MKIGMINGSPKAKGSCSGYILGELAKSIKDGNEVLEVNTHSRITDRSIFDDIYQCDVLVFSMPLYVDGIPSHFLLFLEELKNYFQSKDKKDIFVYTIVNCGFYEGEQNKLAIEMMENWCEKSQLIWGLGIGIGAGPMLMSTESVPIGHGPKKNFGIALSYLVENIQKRSHSENMYISPNFPRFAYILIAHRMWEKWAKANGLKKKDLFKNE